MSKIARLRRNRREILRHIASIEEMRRGSVVRQFFPVKHPATHGPKIRGPYALYTCKQKGKTLGRRLRRPEEINRLEEQVKNYHSFRALCGELVKVAEKICEEREKELSAETHLRSQRSRRLTRVQGICQNGKGETE
jgi:Family of unknown function (DUF6788)